jgi:uncharacterized membrane protein
MSPQQPVVQAVEYSGPLPPPAVLQRYDQVVPGAAERILRMAEGQSKHRQALESVVVRSGSRDSLPGLPARNHGSFNRVSRISWLTYYAISRGHVLTGSFLGTVNIVGLVSVFVCGTRTKIRERQSRMERERQR